MRQTKFMSGNQAVAEAVKLSGVQVVAAYPITPQSSIVEYISEMIANGEIDAELIHVESEHSSMSACIGAASVGARAFTATCSQGLALMHECLFIASGLRLPVVMCVVNRALSAPINILCDHSDTMASRDCGWIQFWAETCQEVLDDILISFKVAESISMPAMVNLDAFVLSHLHEPVDVPSLETAKEFLPDPSPIEPLVLPERPGCHGTIAFADYTEEWNYSRHHRLVKSKNLIEKTDDEFARKFGRKYDLVETYRCEDADTILVGMGTMVGTTRDVVDDLRREGLHVGLLKLRVFRPFPVTEIRRALRKAKVVAVMDRSLSYAAAGGPVFLEISNALYNLSDRPLVIDFVLGLGGRDITSRSIRKIVDEADKVQQTGKVTKELIWPDVRKGILKNWAEWHY